jgi:hypothetical protein
MGLGFWKMFLGGFAYKPTYGSNILISQVSLALVREGKT